MSTMLVLKELVQKYYAKYTTWINMAIRFVMGLVVFGLINHNIGFMEKLSSLPITLGLSLICTILPLTFMVLGATLLILIHFAALAIPVALVTFILFVLMYILYFRFTPSKSWIVLLTPIAFVLKVPFVIPVAYGLIGKPVCAVPAAFGTIVYYTLHMAKLSSSMYTGEDAVTVSEGLATFAKQIIANKEMWTMVIIMCLSIFIVYAIRTKSIDRCWEIASVAGAITGIIGVTAGNIIFNLHISYIAMVLAGCAAVLVGFILEVLFFSMDYSKTEYVQFEDDEYYYYVKAVPKVCVSAPKKMVKHINERKDSDNNEVKDVFVEEDKFATKCLTKELGLNNLDDK